MTFKELIAGLDVNDMNPKEVYDLGQVALEKMIEALAVLKIIRDSLSDEDDDETGLKRFNIMMQSLQAQFTFDMILTPGFLKHVKKYLSECNDLAIKQGAPQLNTKKIKTFAFKMIQDFLKDNDVPVDHSNCACGDCGCDAEEA